MAVDSDLTLRILQKFMGTDCWVHGYITDRFRRADYYINTVDLTSTHSDIIDTITCYRIDVFYLELLLDGISLNNYDIRGILYPLYQEPAALEQFNIDALEITIPTDTLSTTEIEDILHSCPIWDDM